MKRRTKQQKIKTLQRRQQQLPLQNERGEYHFGTGESTAESKPVRSAQASTPKAQDLFAYDVRLIYHDLLRTVVFTSIMIVGLVLIARYF
jgi:hypothetical protein